MKSIFQIIIVLICFTACNSKKENSSNVITLKGDISEINLGDEIKIVVPTMGEKLDSCKPYTHIEIWKANKKVYQDTSENEYRFLCNNICTKAIKLNNNRYVVLVQKFDAPDIDKTVAVYLKDDEYESERLLPLLEAKDINNDGEKEYYGILNTIDGYSNGDSCYYNPTLYYKITSEDICLDSILTRKKIKEVWGDFYGYEQSDKIVLPCNR